MHTEQHGGLPIKLWTDGVPVEQAAMSQIIAASRLPFAFSHIAVMPDVHVGQGSTIGTVLATKGAICPAAVGVDIGCGMSATPLPKKILDIPPNSLRKLIEESIPVGRTHNGGPGDEGSWSEVPAIVEERWIRSLLCDGYKQLEAADPSLIHPRALRQLGTLGTGNHFIEISLDETGDPWLVLHSGSRGPGNRIGTFYTRKAKELMNQFFIDLPHPDLAYLPIGTPLFNDYIKALHWAQGYSAVNRQLMVDLILSNFGVDNADVRGISCHHNYVAWEQHFGKTVMITRKGAVRAAPDSLGIIPGSMGAKSFIVQGKGNRDSFMSCSHGAGRAMSRTAAKARFTLADHEKATEGIACRKDAAVIDETPGAYKDIDAVMAAQTDLITVLHTLKQIVCVKG